jgi:hypothetical protein
VSDQTPSTRLPKSRLHLTMSLTRVARRNLFTIRLLTLSSSASWTASMQQFWLMDKLYLLIQTGSGKTYSMGIGLDAINTGQDPESIGIVPRAIRSIFDHISDNSKKHGTMYKSTATVSFLELYNEELVDLLNPRPRSAQGSPTGPSIREDGSGKIVWHNILEEPVNSPQELMRFSFLMQRCSTRYPLSDNRVD